MANIVAGVTTAASKVADEVGEILPFAKGEDITEKLKKRNEYYHKMFKVNEDVIESFACALVKTLPTQGRIFISPNYVCFHANIFGKEIMEVIPLEEITLVEKQNSAFVLPNAITITVKSYVKYNFSSFVFRDDCFNLLDHLYRCANMLLHEQNRHISRRPTNPSEQDTGGLPQESVDKLNNNRESTKRILQKAEETRQVGTSTLVELNNQGEQIKRVNRQMDDVHQNLDTSERLIRGMESIVGAMGNMFRSKKSADKNTSASNNNSTDKNTGGAGDEEDSTKLPPRDVSDSEWEIIRINKHARYQDRKFRFGRSCIYRIRPDGEVAQTIQYVQISGVTVRGLVPCRFELHTREGKKFELVTGEIKEVVKEIVKRCANGASVIFEEGSEKFSYDTTNPQGFGRKVRGGATTASNDNLGARKELLGTSPGSFTSSVGKNSTPKIVGVSTTASQTASGGSITVQEKLKEQDQDLEQISAVVGDLKQIASQMGGEIDKQNKDLEDLDITVTRGVDRIKKDNKRIQKML